MDKSKFEGHTPGPWLIKKRKVRSDAHQYGYHRTIKQPHARHESHDKEICKLAGANHRFYKFSWYMSDDEAEANAALIAAAPDLLAENERLRAALVIIRDVPIWDKWAEDDNSWLTQAVATMQQIAADALADTTADPC